MAEMEAKATNRPFESLFKDQEFVFQYYGVAKDLPEASSTETIEQVDNEVVVQTALPVEYYGFDPLTNQEQLLVSLESAAEREFLKHGSVHPDWLSGTPRTVFRLDDSQVKGSAIPKDCILTQSQMETELVAFKRQILRQKYLSQ